MKSEAVLLFVAAVLATVCAEVFFEEKFLDGEFAGGSSIYNIDFFPF